MDYIDMVDGGNGKLLSHTILLRRLISMGGRHHFVDKRLVGRVKVDLDDVQFEDMGCPDTVTVTVQPGDKLNGH